MPWLRGIEVSLTTRPDHENIPEYPHPEGSSARILTNLSGSPAAHGVYRKAGPTVSVYIPSIPGTCFAIDYRINNAPPPPCKYVFFRLYINARPITAWGVDPAVRSSGKIARSLWAPCTLYGGQVGFEGRNFVFLPGKEYQSVAEDGGIIEIQVFRAKERRARAPRVEVFRFHENYGIAAPSVGLLDRPQDVCFYDWHLLDAKDSPFACFCLHYRSWKNLKQLSLIPAHELERFYAASPKALRDIVKAEEGSRVSDGLSEDRSSRSGDSDRDLFFDSKCEVDADNGRVNGFAQYSLGTPPELFPAAAVSSASLPQPSKASRDAYHESYLQRPLPELPVEGASKRLGPPSVSSAMSVTQSIAPSLLQCLDDEALDPDGIEVCTAQLVPLSPSHSSLHILPHEKPNNELAAEYSISDYETSPKSTGYSTPEGRLSPSRYLPMTGSGLERGIALFASPITGAEHARSPNFRQSLPADFSGNRNLSRQGRLTFLSGPESKSHSPLPAQFTATSEIAHRESSPRTDRRNSLSLLAGLRKIKPSGSPGRLASIFFGRDWAKSADGGGFEQPSKVD